MINAILTGIINLIMGLVNVLLSPIDAIIKQFMPDFSSFVSTIVGMFDYVNNGLGFTVSMLGLTPTILSAIIGYYTFKLTVPLMISAIKQVIKWYKAMKP